MSGNIIHDFPGWVKDVNRRVELLERRRIGTGGGGGGGIVDGESGRAVWTTQQMAFVGGLATAPMPAMARTASTVVASFAQQIGGPLNGANIEGGYVKAWAAVPDGTYLVSLVFGVKA